MRHKPTLVLDFDGVLHSYTSGWHGAEVVADGPVAGAQAFCALILAHFDVWIVSSRCCQTGGPQAITQWLQLHEFPAGIVVSPDGSKPPGVFLTIDDRVFLFAGIWPSLEVLQSFVPWTQKTIQSGTKS